VLHTPWFAGLGLWAWGTFVVLLASAPAVWRVVRRGPKAERADIVVAFAVGTYVYLALAAVLLDTNEVMRHRLKVDGLLLLAAAVRSFARPSTAAAQNPVLP
jgi:heme A synthase